MSKALDVFPYVITCGDGSKHEYWYVCEEDYPVDVNYCESCVYWSAYSKWCTYFEDEGELLPDGHIIVHDDGRHTCTCRKIGRHKRRVTLGVVARRRKKDD